MEPRADAASGLPSALELASAPVVAVRGDLDAMDALREMYRLGVHHLAVLGSSSAGLVTAVDLLFGVAGRVTGEAVPVESLCRRPAPDVEADADGDVAAQRMIESGIDALFVTVDGEIRGVLTAVDLVRAVAERAAPPRDEG